MKPGSLVHEVLETAVAGTPTVFVVEGEAGTGKTSLCRDVVARAHGWLALSVTAVEPEAAYPLVVLSDLLCSVASHVGRLHELLVRAALADALEQRAGPLTLGTTLSNLLNAASRERPVLLVVDDCHWCDADSWAALLFALQRSSSGRVAALLTLRTGTVGALPTASIRRRLQGPDVCRRTPVGYSCFLELTDHAHANSALSCDAPSPTTSGGAPSSPAR